MSDKVFFDTNVLIYATVSNDPRSAAARAVLAGGGSISVQVLNEFANTAFRKFKRSWSEISAVAGDLRALCSECLALTENTHHAATRLARQYGYGFYDSLILASALEAGCAVLLSEDMQDGQKISGRMTIRNPFTHMLP